jgi:hypothetical protein
MKNYHLCLTFFLPIVPAFVAVNRRIPLKLLQLKDQRTTDRQDVLEHEGYDKVRAIECAEVFGRCSLEEVRKLRDGAFYK